MPYANTHSLLLGNNHLVNLDTCPDENFKYLLQRLSEDIVFIMNELKVDNVEMMILKTILLFDPGKLLNFGFKLQTLLLFFIDAKKLNDVTKVTQIRDFVFLVLSQYCKVNSSHDPSRFAKLRIFG